MAPGPERSRSVSDRYTSCAASWFSIAHRSGGPSMRRNGILAFTLFTMACGGDMPPSGHPDGGPHVHDGGPPVDAGPGMGGPTFGAPVPANVVHPSTSLPSLPE